MIRKTIRYLQDNKVINETKEKKAKKYERTITDQINAITLDTNLMPPRIEDKDFQSRSMMDDKKMSRNMTLKEFLSVTINASLNNPTLNDRQIVSMIREDTKPL